MVLVHGDTFHEDFDPDMLSILEEIPSVPWVVSLVDQTRTDVICEGDHPPLLHIPTWG